MKLSVNSVICGDCIDVMSSIEKESINLILCDLPYGTTKCKWDVILPFDKLWEQYNRIIKPNGAILLFGNEPFSSKLRLSNLPDFRYDWYWQKDRGANFLFGNKMPLKNIEIVSCFYKKQPTYNPQKTINPKGATKMHLGKNPSKISNHVKEIMGDSWTPSESKDKNFFGKNYEPDKLLPNQLVYFARDIKGRIHPTQKPLLLVEYLIKTYTNEGDIVLDSCSGSGTVGLACKNLSRNFILIEKEQEYVDLSKKRIFGTV